MKRQSRTGKLVSRDWIVGKKLNCRWVVTFAIGLRRFQQDLRFIFKNHENQH